MKYGNHYLRKINTLKLMHGVIIDSFTCKCCFIFIDKIVDKNKSVTYQWFLESGRSLPARHDIVPRTCEEVRMNEALE